MEEKIYMGKQYTAQEQEDEMYEVISKCQHPEFYVCKMLNGELYFNPIHHCGLWVFHEDFELPGHTWWTCETNFFDFINRVYKSKLNSSPAPVFENIINLYHQYNVDIPEYAHKISSNS